MRASIHPFPARMAPELALESLKSLKSATVLDPMSGSGTVARVALDAGLSAIGIDLDPLAVLISKVSTTHISEETISQYEKIFYDKIKVSASCDINLPWIDGNAEAERFTEFWFGERQRSELRRIAYVLSASEISEIPEDVVNLFRISLSRIIVTKQSAASLAQDTSHSRPHRVLEFSDYDVIAGFFKSVNIVKKRVAAIPNGKTIEIRRGDARDLSSIGDESIDAVLTSPPYLNAIDYLRGHRMSLIWLGHSISELRETRSKSIGSERKADANFDVELVASIKKKMGEIDKLPHRHNGMIDRYLVDLYNMLSEVKRVLKEGANATFVMGDSCLRGIYIKNSEALAGIAEYLDLSEISKFERDLPQNSRYLPTPASGALSKRMRKEVILSFSKR